MPVALAPPSSNANHSRCSLSCASPSAKCMERKSKTLTIGLVNNMPDGAVNIATGITPSPNRMRKV